MSAYLTANVPPNRTAHLGLLHLDKLNVCGPVDEAACLRRCAQLAPQVARLVIGDALNCVRVGGFRRAIDAQNVYEKFRKLEHVVSDIGGFLEQGRVVVEEFLVEDADHARA